MYNLFHVIPKCITNDMIMLCYGDRLSEIQTSAKCLCLLNVVETFAS